MTKNTIPKINGDPQKFYELLRVIGDNHVATSEDTPIRPDAFDLDNEAKIELIAKHFEEILNILGMDLTDDSLSGTPMRVAKMYVEEIFSGLHPDKKPEVRLFDNKYKYDEMLVERNIRVQSHCEHHLVPIIGKAHVAYISSGKVIGLSKINRIVDYYARRPQVQERLTVQIANELKKVLQTDDVAIVIEATHMCVTMRGVKDENSSTVTTHFSGKFKEGSTKKEFLTYLNSGTKLVS